MKKSLLFLFITLALVSCHNKPSNKNQAADATTIKTVNAPAKGKYTIKSGIVEFKSSMMGMDVVQTLYFDDYGARELTQTTMDMMGTKINTFMLTKDGFVYNFDSSKKTGTKNSSMAGATGLNFEDLSDKVLKDWKLKKEGKETILGKECVKYSFENESFSMKGFYWVWNGIALKSTTEMSTMKMEMEATNIQENISIPSDKFDIPADITFQ